MEIKNSQITAVTVYTDRAQVTRAANLDLTTGEHKIFFSDLPQNIDPNSIQAGGHGNAYVKDVRFSKKHYEKPNDEQVAALQLQKQDLLDRLTEIENNKAQAIAEKEFVNRISIAATEQAQTMKKSSIEPEKWMQMVTFYRDKISSTDAEIRQCELKKRQTNQTIDKINRQLAELDNQTHYVKNIIEVSLIAQQNSQITLNLTYIVTGPSWNPVYDLRVDSINKKMYITYSAVVRQLTGENWDNVALSLSTAQPKISGVVPTLTPWRICLYKEISDRRDKAMFAMPMAKTKNEKAKMVFEEDEMISDEAAPIMQPPKAVVTTGATSVLFSIDGGSTINSNNIDTKVTITTNDFPAQFTYTAIPKLSLYAYLKAKVKNNTEYPFLPGKSNIFIDNTFVANSNMNLVVPEQEFETSLGIDEAIKIEYKFIKKYEKTEGLISKRTKYIYDYKIIITNNKKTLETINIFDQLPIPANEEINVELIHPEYKKDNEYLKISEERYIEIIEKIEPTQKIEIPISFSVEYPKSESIVGL